MAGAGPDPPVHHPLQQRATPGNTVSTKAAATRNYGQEHGTEQKEKDDTSEGDAMVTSSLPSSILAGIRVKESSIAARKGAPGWGCFYPVVLPPKMSSIRDHIYPNFPACLLYTSPSPRD